MEQDPRKPQPFVTATRTTSRRTGMLLAAAAAVPAVPLLDNDKRNKLAYCCCRTLSLGMMPLEVAFRRANLISTCRSCVSSASHRRKASLPAGPPPPPTAAAPPPPLLAEASALPAPALACSSRRSR